MAHVIAFRSATFDIAHETPNPINPIAGESLLRWLREKLRAESYETTAPEAEDWGWYIDASGGASYLVGASADASDGSNTTVDWTVQIDKHRSLKEKLPGTNKLMADDPRSALIERLIRQIADVSAVEVDRDA